MMRTLLYRVVCSTVHRMRSITSWPFTNKRSNVCFNNKTMMTLFHHNVRDTSSKDISILAAVVTGIILTNLSNLHTSACDQQRIKEGACEGLPPPEGGKEEEDSASFGLFLAEIRKVLSADQIELDAEERKQRGKPWSSYHTITDYPRVIVSPSTTEQVSGLMKICHRLGVPVVPFGGGTSLEGQVLSPKGAVSVDFKNMMGVLAFNEKDLDVTVQAGLGYLELNDFLRDKGLWFPLDPGPGATVGGMCACRCSGSTAVRYGSMRENVLNLTAVLSDGTIIKTGSRARKSSAGYDLTRLLIGSEGTLAVITEATLKLHGIPKVSYALRISFPSIRAAADTARDTLNCGVTVGRCELLDVEMISIVNTQNPSMEPWPERTTLLYELTGPSQSSVREQLSIVSGIAASHGGGDPVCVEGKEENDQLWRLRKECLWSAMSSALSDLISATREALDASWLPAPIIAHAGDGNFHVLLMLRPDHHEDIKEAHRLAGEIAVRAISMGGTCTGEHGIGVGKKSYLRLEMGEGSMRLMSVIKRTMDPGGILNPGKVLDAGEGEGVEGVEGVEGHKGNIGRESG